MLAARRLTEAQLRDRLARRGVEGTALEESVAACRRGGFIDDALFARLFVETRRKALGDRRLVAELVQRGVDRESAVAAVSDAEMNEEARLAAALERLLRQRPQIGLPAAARSLERLGFSAPAVYRQLRRHAAESIDLSDVATV